MGSRIEDFDFQDFSIMAYVVFKVVNERSCQFFEAEIVDRRDGPGFSFGPIDLIHRIAGMRKVSAFFQIPDDSGVCGPVDGDAGDDRDCVGHGEFSLLYLIYII